MPRAKVPDMWSVGDLCAYAHADGGLELGIDGVEWRIVDTDAAREFALAILAACMVAEAAGDER